MRSEDFVAGVSFSGTIVYSLDIRMKVTLNTTYSISNIEKIVEHRNVIKQK